MDLELTGGERGLPSPLPPGFSTHTFLAAKLLSEEGGFLSHRKRASDNSFVVESMLRGKHLQAAHFW